MPPSADALFSEWRLPWAQPRSGAGRWGPSPTWRGMSAVIFFPKGVASGDPDSNSVRLWTRRSASAENLALKLIRAGWYSKNADWPPPCVMNPVVWPLYALPARGLY